MYMKNLILLVLSLFFFSCEEGMPDKSQAYIGSQALIQDMVMPIAGKVNFAFMDYFADDLHDSTYLIVSTFDYKELGKEMTFKYKAKVRYLGGKWQEKQNWRVLNFEEYKGL